MCRSEPQSNGVLDDNTEGYRASVQQSEFSESTDIPARLHPQRSSKVIKNLYKAEHRMRKDEFRRSYLKNGFIKGL